MDSSDFPYSAAGIIPARFASTRFPGKPLVDINGMSMIERVYRRASECSLLKTVVVATDDSRIFDHVSGFGGRVIMTSEHHPSGTDRIAETIEILQKAGEFYHIAVNIQGDEPFIRPEQIEKVVRLFDNPATEIATLVKVIARNEDLFNPNVVKVSLARDKRALLFSRSTIPYIRGKNEEEWLKSSTFYKHIGIYAYLTEVLTKLAGLPMAPPEQAESLEQLRWLWNGYSIYADITDFETVGIDTPEDLSKLTNIS